LIVRTELAHFDERLRYGEDVDLVWRLDAVGWRCRFEPAVVARHRTRASLAEWVSQRIRYGSSAAPLSTRHPDALAPVRMNGWSAATWVCAAIGARRVAAVLGVGSTIALVRKLRGVPAAESLRLAGLGHLFAGRTLVAALLRVWWPITAVAALVSPRIRRAAITAAIALPLLDMRKERIDVRPAEYVALRVLDDLSYGAGVWLGAIENRTLAPLLPSISPWPPR
jgi:hypothetical protein